MTDNKVPYVPGHGLLDGRTAVVTGGAQSSIACVRDKNVLRSSIGASILWQSPLGPIRFDYAYALSKDDGQYGLGPLGFAKYGGDRLQAFRFSGGTRF